MTDLQKIKDALSNQDPCYKHEGHNKISYKIVKDKHEISINVMPEKILFVFNAEGRLQGVSCWKY